MCYNHTVKRVSDAIACFALASPTLFYGRYVYP